MTFSRIAMRFAGAIICGSMFSTAPTLVYAGDACKNVKFQIKNQREARIKIKKVEYFNKANGKTQSERLTKECASGATCTTSGDNLRDSEGEDLSNFVFYFNDEEADDGWSKIDWKTQKKQPIDKECYAGVIYKGDPTWTIN